MSDEPEVAGAVTASEPQDLVRSSATEGLRWVPGQTYTMGSDRHYPEEGPAHPVAVDGFWSGPTRSPTHSSQPSSTRQGT